MIGVETFFDAIDVGVNHIMDFWRHDGVRFIQQQDDILAGARRHDHVFLVFREYCHGKKRDGDAQQHTFGETDDRAHLVIEPVEFHSVDHTRHQSKQCPDDKRRSDVNRQHGDKLIPRRLVADFRR